MPAPRRTATYRLGQVQHPSHHQRPHEAARIAKHRMHRERRAAPRRIGRAKRHPAVSDGRVEPDHDAIQHEQRCSDPVTRRSDEAYQQPAYDRQSHCGQHEPVDDTKRIEALVAEDAGESVPSRAQNRDDYCRRCRVSWPYLCWPRPRPGTPLPSRAARSFPAYGRNRPASRRRPTDCAGPARKSKQRRSCLSGVGGRTTGVPRAIDSKPGYRCRRVRRWRTRQCRQPKASRQKLAHDVRRRSGKRRCWPHGRCNGARHHLGVHLDLASNLRPVM